MSRFMFYSAHVGTCMGLNWKVARCQKMRDDGGLDLGGRDREGRSCQIKSVFLSLSHKNVLMDWMWVREKERNKVRFPHHSLHSLLPKHPLLLGVC